MAAPASLRTRSRLTGSPTDLARGLRTHWSQTRTSLPSRAKTVTSSPTSGEREQTGQGANSSMTPGSAARSGFLPHRIAPAMGPVSASVEVDAARERVFDFVADLGNRLAFTDHFVSGFHLSRLDSTGVGAGARFRFHAAPQAIWVDTVVEQLVRPQRISERGHGGRANRIPCAIEWEFLADAGGLTTVRVVHWTSPTHPLDRAREVLGGAAYWYERNWQIAMRRLRELLESKAALGGRVVVAGGSRHATGIA